MKSVIDHYIRYITSREGQKAYAGDEIIYVRDEPHDKRYEITNIDHEKIYLTYQRTGVNYEYPHGYLSIDFRVVGQ